MLSANATDFSTLPLVRSMGVMLFDPCWAEQAHTSTSCELLYVLNGEIELHLGGQRYLGRPGDVLLVPSGTEHRDAFDLDIGLQVFMVFFHWRAEEDYFQHVSNGTLCRLPAHCKAEVAMQVERLRHDTGGDAGVDHLLASARLLTILALILRETQLFETTSDGKNARGRRRALLLAAKRYLSENYNHPIALDDIARALDVSAFYLSHIFSEESDFSLFTYLTTLRMERAYALLRAGELNVSEVAQKVGYENGNYFAKVFKKHFGCSPSEVREGTHG